jgi:hypothetical protein
MQYQKSNIVDTRSKRERERERERENTRSKEHIHMVGPSVGGHGLLVWIFKEKASENFTCWRW